MPRQSRTAPGAQQPSPSAGSWAGRGRRLGKGAWDQALCSSVPRCSLARWGLVVCICPLGLRDLAECPRHEVWTLSPTPPHCGGYAVPAASGSQETDFRKVVLLLIFKPKVLLLIYWGLNIRTVFWNFSLTKPKEGLDAELEISPVCGSVVSHMSARALVERDGNIRSRCGRVVRDRAVKGAKADVPATAVGRSFQRF